MKPLLSILICTLEKRAELLKRLLSCLHAQNLSHVEILTSCDDGQISTGEKRNRLVAMSQGCYVAFIDDDDLVSDDYVYKVTEACKLSKDCCSLQGEITQTVIQNRVRTKRTRIFRHGLSYGHWYEKDGVYYRTPNHLNAIKREIAIGVPFPTKNIGEDKSFSDRVFPLLHSEVLIPGTIYYYYAS